MTLRLLPVAACLISACSLSLARPTWTRLDATDLGTHHGDLGSARYSAGRVQADTLFEAKRATLLEGNATPYRSIVSAVVIDCPTWAYAIRRIRYQSGARGGGQTVEEFTDDTLTFMGFRPIRPGLPMDKLASRLCPRPYGRRPAGP